MDRSIHFYQQVLGMRLLRTSENTEYKYSLAFLGYDDEENSSVIELTYNWGVSKYEMGLLLVTLLLELKIFMPLVKRLKKQVGKLLVSLVQ